MERASLHLGLLVAASLGLYLLHRRRKADEVEEAVEEKEPTVMFREILRLYRCTGHKGYVCNYKYVDD